MVLTEFCLKNQPEHGVRVCVRERERGFIWLGNVVILSQQCLCGFFRLGL